MRIDEIACPHCGDLFDDAHDIDGVITYWGEDGPVELWCCNCDGKFNVQERVLRTYTISEVESKKCESK